MRSVKYVKIEDRLQTEGSAGVQGGLDFSSLLGTWVNTHNATPGIVKVVLTEKNGALTARAFGAGEPLAGDAGEIMAEVVYADSLRSQKAVAFTATYDFGFMTSHLQANMSLGLLIIASFNTFKDGSGRSNYFSREFYHRETASTRLRAGHGASRLESMPCTGTEVPLKPRAARQARGRLDPTSLLGVWVNTNSATGGIVQVLLDTKDGAFSVHAFGACDPLPCDWGEVKAEVFAENVSSDEGKTLLAYYDLGFLEAYLHAWVKLGVLVIVKFDRFKDGSGRSNRFSREFFYRLETAGDIDE